MVTDHWSGHVDNVFALAFVQRWYAVMKLHTHVPFCVCIFICPALVHAVVRMMCCAIAQCRLCCVLFLSLH